MKKKFKIGDTIIFDPSSFNKKFWDKLSEQEKKSYYGRFGYGSQQPVLFTFLAYHKPQVGHCSIINMDTGGIEVMAHVNNFRLVTEDEC